MGVTQRYRPAFRSYWRGWLVILTTGLIAHGLSDRVFIDGLSEHAGGIPQSWLFGGGLMLVDFLVMVLNRHRDLYEIEEGVRLRSTSGVFQREIREFAISEGIQTDVTQSVAGRLLDFGDVAFWPGDQRSRLEWRRVARPRQLAAAVAGLKRHSTGAASSSEAEETPGGARIPEAPTVKSARKERRTGFGRGAEGPLMTTAPRQRVRCLEGPMIDNGDGTVTHEASGLECVRAPFGMVWTGEGFAGTPLRLNWGEATELFGTGAAAKHPLSFNDLAHTAAKEEYRPGRCQVVFAGRDDWRLPTAEELVQFFPVLWGLSDRLRGLEGEAYSRKEMELMPHLWLSGEDGAPFMDASGYPKRVRCLPPSLARLFPELSERTFFLWTANHDGLRCGWAFGDSDSSFMDAEKNLEYEVVLVRQGTGTEYVGRKTVEDDAAS